MITLRVLLVVAAVTLILLLAVASAYIAGRGLDARLTPSKAYGGNSRQVKGSLAWTPPEIVESYVWLPNGLRVDITVRLPDPCHHVDLEGYRRSGDKLLVELSAWAPPPGTYCIQVVPRPFKASLFFPVSKGSYTLEILVNGKPVKQISITP